MITVEIAWMLGSTFDFCYKSGCHELGLGCSVWVWFWALDSTIRDFLFMDRLQVSYWCPCSNTGCGYFKLNKGSVRCSNKGRQRSLVTNEAWFATPLAQCTDEKWLDRSYPHSKDAWVEWKQLNKILKCSFLLIIIRILAQSLK